ncbi:sensor histidine kinase [Pseudoduganella umbonata]|uniref:histidine kinase n=1 Tax=Pseudoduganella umbonata TaxID=864828 RepID=A0A7W5EF21_9BURK|nr:ATP-binding protein [Pseudoduganella umbonata]MBB3224102.1 signal transduction histidine kinase [Pseudoduganella umbonata]
MARPGSIRLQLMLAYVAGLGLVLAVATVMVLYVFDWDSPDTTAKKGLTLQAGWIEESIQYDAAGHPVRLDPEAEAAWIYTHIANDVKYAVLDGRGKPLFGSAPREVLMPPGLEFAHLPSIAHLTIDGVPFTVLTKRLPGKGAHYYLQVAGSDRINTLFRRSIVRPIYKAVAWVSGVSLLVLFGVVHLTLRRSLRQLQQASRAAAQIEPSNLSSRLDTHGLPSELTPLVEAFNKALDRLEHGYRVQQEFLAGAAHELKTPLALIRGQIELGGTSDRAALLADVDMMARQVHQLLHLADVSESHNYVFERTSLPAVAAEVIAYLGRLADRRGVTLRMSAHKQDGEPVLADRSAVFILLKNLVENAIRHASAAGTVLVAIEQGILYVQDDGPGIAEQDLDKLYVRFWRGADRRDDGAGLGLAICHEIVATHGWTIEAGNAWPGARFTIRFPKSAVAGKSPVMEEAA